MGTVLLSPPRGLFLVYTTALFEHKIPSTAQAEDITYNTHFDDADMWNHVSFKMESFQWSVPLCPTELATVAVPGPALTRSGFMQQHLNRCQSRSCLGPRGGLSRAH